jgi:hypothetical protein
MVDVPQLIRLPVDVSYVRPRVSVLGLAKLDSTDELTPSWM